MGSEWQTIKLSDVLGKSGYIRGPFGSALRRPELKSEGIPVYEQQHAIYNTRTFRFFIDEDKFNELSRFTVQENDLIISCSGTLGKVSLIRKDDPKGIISQALLILRPDTNIMTSKYLYYFISSFKGYHSLVSVSSGSVQVNIAKRSVIESIELLVPPVAEQRAIAAILGALDDKIELNTQMNETLEAMAQALFKSWFVDFEPFRDQGMQDSPLGPIPRGWRLGSVGEIAINERRGADPSTLPDDTPYIGLEHMPRGSIVLDAWESVANVTSNKFAFKRREILFGKLRPYFRKVGIAFIDGVCSSDILVIRPTATRWFSFLICQLSRKEFIDYTDAVSSGTKMPRVNWLEMAKYKLPLPVPEMAYMFDQHVRPLVDRMEANTLESRTLAAIRDILLLKLLSGEIRVKDTKKFVEGKR